jgi:hypothetical protein
MQPLGELFGGETHALAHGDGRGLVVQADEEQAHVQGRPSTQGAVDGINWRTFIARLS